MYESIDRLVTIALPSIRYFRGLNRNSFDGKGNYSFGIKDCTILPEITVENSDKTRCLDIAHCTTARNDDESLRS